MKKLKTISSLKDHSDIDPNCAEAFPSSESDTAHLDGSGDSESLSNVDKVFVHEQCKEPEMCMSNVRNQKCMLERVPFDGNLKNPTNEDGLCIVQ
jgi:hypothetical protein